MKKILLSIIILALSMAAISGCTDREELKQDLTTALAKQAQAKNYQFSGEADIYIQPAIFRSSLSDPITTGLLTMLGESKISWTGVSSNDPIQLELQLKVTPKGLNQSIDLPLIIKDNKMYFSIPGLNQNEEYFSLTPDKLTLSEKTVPKILSTIAESIDSSWLEEADSTKNSQHFRTIIIKITEDNVQKLADSLYDILPAAKDMSGARDNFDRFLQDIKLDKPGEILVSIDEQGFIRQEKIDLDVSFGTEKKVRFHAQWMTDKINQNPEFTLPVPQKVKPFEDVLRFIQPK